MRRVDSSDESSLGAMKDGQVEFANVEPGDYRIEPLNPRWHVESISVNGKSAPGALLHVTGEGQKATVALGTGSVTMTGYVAREGKPVSGAMVVLVPANGDHSFELYRRDQSNLDGSFSFSAVVPGNYLLLAVTDGWPLEWGKPDALAAYLPKAIPVSVAAESGGAMKIEERVPAQPR